jgi:Tfp pilus assembly protein PilO
MRIEKQQLGIFVVLAAAICVFMMQQYGPLRNKIRMMQQVKAEQAAVDIKADEQAKKLPTLKTQLAQMQAVVGEYEVKMPDDRKLGAFLQEIADVMNKHNLSEQVVQPESEIAVDSLMCIPVRIQCKGDLRQMFEFFRSLQGVRRLMRVEQVQLKNALDLNGMITMTARVNIYYRMPKLQANGQL